MTETLYEFKQGPYDVLEFTVKTKDGKAVVAINDGDLGRLPIEDLETVEELRNALNEVEEFLEEVERRKEEL
jgi:bifunctional DNA-binding transcriptional regulator/antitoxin component of YhaV-PrlF toxin-antitoxin module